MNWFSRYYFINYHEQFRKKFCYGLIAPMSTGKTVLTASIISDCLASGKKVGLWLTEGVEEDYIKSIQASAKREINMDNLHILHEDDFIKIDKKKYVNQESYLNEIEGWCKGENFDILFFDNITTSRPYDAGGFAAQSAMAIGFIGLAGILDIPIFYVAHTKKDVSINHQKYLTSEDVRGAATLALKSQTIYMLNVFTIDGGVFPFIEITKHRGFNRPVKFYRLTYDSNKKTYIGDREIDRSDALDAFKRRDKLK